jgi:hypothetical protein
VTEGPRYECDECGYELTDLVRACEGVTCPECGTFHPAPPSARPAWPAWWRVGLALCGPAAGLVSALVAARVMRAPWVAVALGWPLVMVAWVVFAVVVPAFVAAALARAHALHRDRTRRTWQLAAGAVSANAALSAAGAWVMVVL